MMLNDSGRVFQFEVEGRATLRPIRPMSDSSEEQVSSYSVVIALLRAAGL